MKVRIFYQYGREPSKSIETVIKDPFMLPGWGNVHLMLSYAASIIVYHSCTLDFNFDSGWKITENGDNGVFEIKGERYPSETVRMEDLSFQDRRVDKRALRSARQKPKVDQRYYVMLKSKAQHQIR